MSWIRDLVDPKARQWEEFYRNRWAHDRSVRSTHGVNCTGGCSWMVYVKNGLVTWELQATDYPLLDPSIPHYEPRGCQRGIVFSWYNYSPLRVKHPYLRGPLAELWAKARAAHSDPVAAWASIVEDEAARRSYQSARGKGGFVRASWDDCLELVAASMLYTAKRYGPDRVTGFSPIPAMSMLSYAAGSRLLSLFGGTLLSFYDLYADFPPAFPEIWGEKTDAAEAADWFNAALIVVCGSNLNMTRTPDVHFVAEARTRGAKLVVVSPDFSQVSRYADWWIPSQIGMDAALWLAVDHVLLEEFHHARQVPYFTDYLKRFSDSPFLVELEPRDDGHVPGRFLRANRLARYRDVENGDWKLVVLDAATLEPKMPQGTLGFRWQEQKGQWNLIPKDGLDGSEIDPALTLLGRAEETLPVDVADYTGKVWRRGVPVRFVQTESGRIPVTTVLDLMMAQFGVSRGLAGDYPASYQDPDHPFTPAWQERFTGIGQDTVVRLAREWAQTAEKTRGRCTMIFGSGVNHWYHSNLHYRAGATALILTGCVGVNGGGLNHYTGQEKVAPSSSWAMLAMAQDWNSVPRQQNGPSFHYVHSDQWRYDGQHADAHPASGRFAKPHTIDHQAAAVRMGWLPFYPQFDRSSLALVREAEAEGARTGQELVDWTVARLKERRVRFASEDPDAPEVWPRVFLIWRGNALHASAKGHEYFLRHYLGTSSNAIADDVAASSHVEDVAVRPAAPQGKMDLVVDLNLRFDTTALFSDVVLPSASWYEKNDLNTTDLHSFIHPLGQAVPPSWESRADWEIFRGLAEKLSRLSQAHFPRPFRDLVTVPLQHDTPGEIAQPEVRDWSKGECEPVPGKWLPSIKVVERDYPNLLHKVSCLGPYLKERGVEDRGVHIAVGELYDEFARLVPKYRFGDRDYPSIESAVDGANAILFFAPETNGELAYRGFEQQERNTGLKLADLAERNRGVRYDFDMLMRQPRRILTSPCWAGIVNDGRPYAAFVQNVERLIPWRTLSGRQSFYLDHEAYRAFGESLPTFKPRLNLVEAPELRHSPPRGRSAALCCITPHGKWHIHTTYYDDLRMLTLSRGIEPLWLNDADAAELGIADNDWVEMLNDNGAVVTRAVVSARIPRGVCVYYHGPERTIGFPLSPSRGGRGGGTNSITRMRLKPVLMSGGYAQHTYRFNDYGPPSSDRDTTVVVRKLEGEPRWHSGQGESR